MGGDGVMDSLPNIFKIWDPIRVSNIDDGVITGDPGYALITSIPSNQYTFPNKGGVFRVSIGAIDG